MAWFSERPKNVVLPAAEVVLVGAGPTHLQVIHRYGQAKQRPFRLTLVNSTAHSISNSHLAGVIAGDLKAEAAQVDLGHYCRANRAKLIVGDVSHADLAERRIYVAHRSTPLAYDALSFDLGRVPDRGDFDPGPLASWSVQPVPQFLRELDQLDEDLAKQAVDEPWQLAVIGDGLTAVEMALAIGRRWAKSSRLHGRGRVSLLTPGEGVVPRLAPRAQRRIVEMLDQAQIKVETKAVPKRGHAGQLELSDGRKLSCQGVIWADAVLGAPVLKACGLSVDEQGCVPVQSNLEAPDHVGVYAAGDASALKLPFSISRTAAVPDGMGRLLAANLTRRFVGLPQLDYRIPKRPLTFLAASPHRVIAIWGNWSWGGGRARRMAEAYAADRLEQFRGGIQAPRVSTFIESGNLSVEPCRAAGAAVPQDILRRTFPSEGQIQAGDSAHLTNLEAFTSDLYLFGQVAATEALDRVASTGSQAPAFDVGVTLAYGPKACLDRDLQSMVGGIESRLESIGCRIGRLQAQVAAGPAVVLAATGLREHDRVPRRQPSEGDILILTRPIGMGMMIAGHARRHISSRHLWQALDHIARPQHQIMQELAGYVVGDGPISSYGLASRLRDLGQATETCPAVHLEALPVYNGVLKAIAAGIRSCLHVQNRMEFDRSLHGLSNRELMLAELLFDPQTAGPFLLAVPPGQADTILQQVREQACNEADVVGQIQSRTVKKPFLISL